MIDYRNIIARNLISLRVAAQYTQAEVAAKLSYSDKAVSKWERAESIPDVAVLKALADMYGVTVDYLLEEHDASVEVPKTAAPRRMTRNQALITLISVAGVWFLAVSAFAVCLFFERMAWMLFLWAVPVSTVVALVLTCIWGSRKLCFTFISLLLWSLAASMFFSFFGSRPWMMFVGAAILQLIVVLAFGIRHLPNEKNKEKADAENSDDPARGV